MHPIAPTDHLSISGSTGNARASYAATARGNQIHGDHTVFSQPSARSNTDHNTTVSDFSVAISQITTTVNSLANEFKIDRQERTKDRELMQQMLQQNQQQMEFLMRFANGNGNEAEAKRSKLTHPMEDS